MNNCESVLYKNAIFYTLDPFVPTAKAILVSGGRITKLFIDDDIAEAAAVEKVDLGGRTVIPGITDSHIHLGMFANSLNEADLSEAKSEDECVGILKKFARGKQPVDWIFGRRWGHNLWDKPELPSKKSLDKFFPQNPVVLQSRCHHLVWANTAAMTQLNFTEDSISPDGGEIQKDSSGIPTGIFKETAADFLLSLCERFRTSDLKNVIKSGIKELHKCGVVAVHSPEDVDVFNALEEIKKSGELNLRVNYFFPLSYLNDLIKLNMHSGFGDEWLRIGGVKLFIDGSLGGRTAYMFEPFENEPENYGMCLLSKDELGDLLLRLNSNNLVAKVHAIGDKAVHETLEALCRIVDMPDVPKMKNRIEHFQLFSDDDIDKIKFAKPVASVQPVHLCADHAPADALWGNRSRYAYAFNTINKCGSLLAFGSDSPVEPFNPFYGIYAALTRCDLDGKPDGGWYPAEKIDIKTALQAYTINPAKASDESVYRGSLSIGKVADFVVIDRDIFAIPQREIKDVKAVMTVINGEIVYRA